MVKRSGRSIHSDGRRYRRSGRDRLGRLRRTGNFRHRPPGAHRVQANRPVESRSAGENNPAADQEIASMTPGRLEKETPLRATLRILGWILFVITGIALLTFSLLSSNKKTEKTGVVFAINSQPRVLPTIRFTDAKERAMTLQDFRGKFVLLNIWATWCVPCRKEMPTLDRLQAKLGGPDFAVVALSIDRGGASVGRGVFE